MRTREALVLLGTLSTTILAAESSRPRGVGPDCMFYPSYFPSIEAPQRANMSTSCQILQRQREVYVHLEPKHLNRRLSAQRRLLRLSGRLRRTWHRSLHIHLEPLARSALGPLAGEQHGGAAGLLLQE